MVELLTVKYKLERNHTCSILETPTGKMKILGMYDESIIESTSGQHPAHKALQEHFRSLARQLIHHGVEITTCIDEEVVPYLLLDEYIDVTDLFDKIEESMPGYSIKVQHSNESTNFPEMRIWYCNYKKHSFVHEDNYSFSSAYPKVGQALVDYFGYEKLLAWQLDRDREDKGKRLQPPAPGASISEISAYIMERDHITMKILREHGD